jgi:hypothetical protein
LSASSVQASGAQPRPNAFHCSTWPRCDHVWHYDFRVNRQRYRARTETADKQRAKDIESKERTRIRKGRHGIRRQPDITFAQFSKTYLTDHADLHKRSADRDREIIRVLNRAFGSLILHEITAHRIEQFKRERLTGRWRAHGAKGGSKPIQPATVNRELDTLKSVLSKAVEWGKLLESPARNVKRLKVDNRRTRILTEDEQRRLLEAAPRKLRAFVTLALSQLLFSLGCRSFRYTMPQLGLFTNPWLSAAIAASTLLQIGVVTIPFVRPVFDVVPVSFAWEWGAIALLAMTPVTVIEVTKLVQARLRRRRDAGGGVRNAATVERSES